MTCFRPRTSLLLAALLLLGGCAAKPPTIAHVHVGHALTGAHDTPDGEGYFVVAEERTREANVLVAERVRPGASMDALRSSLRDLNDIVNDRPDYALAGAVEEAISHIEFAADSADATPNVRRSAEEFKRNADGVLYRAGLVNLYVQDALNTDSRDELDQLADEIVRLVRAIREGEDMDGDDRVGNTPREVGMVQLRQELDAMIAREDPPYATVDRWYLLNLVRMPSGDWIFRRSGGQSGMGY